MQQASVIFKALGDETRLRIIHLLSHQQLCVCHLMEALAISQAKASRHLAVLRQAGLVTSQKQAQWIWYQLNEHSLLNIETLLAFIAGQPGADADLKRMHALDPALICTEPLPYNRKEC